MSAWSRTRAELGEERIDHLDELDLEGWLDDQPRDPIARLLEETEDLGQDDVPTEEVTRPELVPPVEEPTVPTVGV